MADTMLLGDIFPCNVIGSGQPAWHGAIYEIPSDTPRTVEMLQHAAMKVAPTWTCSHRHRSKPTARFCARDELRKRPHDPQVALQQVAGLDRGRV